MSTSGQVSFLKIIIIIIKIWSPYNYACQKRIVVLDLIMFLQGGCIYQSQLFFQVKCLGMTARWSGVSAPTVSTCTVS